MPWQPLPRIAFAVATYPFQASSPADLPLELGDELYIIEEGGRDRQWLRGYLIAPPSLLAGLTSLKGQTLEARVFSGIFPRSCVEVREVLGESAASEESEQEAREYIDGLPDGNGTLESDGSASSLDKLAQKIIRDGKAVKHKSVVYKEQQIGGIISLAVKRDPNSPKPPAPVPLLKIGDETPTSSSEPLVDEIASCLREWHSTNLHELLLSQNYQSLDRMTSLVQSIDLSRRQFLHAVLTNNELQILREQTVWNLVKGNKLLSGEVIVRDPAERGRVLTGDDSAVAITKLQSMMSLLDEPPQPPVEASTLHHLLVDMKAFVGASTESTTLVFYLASKPTGSTAITFSESYIVDVPVSGALASVPKAAQMRTLFTDLASADIGEGPSADGELYLIVKVQQIQQPVPSRIVGSRAGMASRDDSPPIADGGKTTPSPGKSSRRSLMWGKSTPRAQYPRSSPMSKMNSLSEQPQSRSASREAPPSTAGSRGPGAPSKSIISTLPIARTVGIGALKLNSIMKHNAEIEQVLNIWAPSTRLDQDKQENGEGWDDVLRDLMDSKTGIFERSRKAERLQVHLTPFVSHDADALIKATPTLLSDITRTSKMGFSGAPTKARSDIYITINGAFLPRHALLSRSVGSAVPISTTLNGSNLQLTLEVRKASGERIENCVFPSSNSEAVSSWESSATERGDAWNQTFRLAIPPNEVQGSHVVMVLADFPGPTFAICHVSLWDQQAFIRDGHHSLLLYKYDDSTAMARPNSSGKGGYLSLPWNARGKDDVSKDEAVTGPIATLRIQTYLCSTKFSQDKVLLGLLKWKDQPSGQIPELLKRLVFVPEIEIVKLLNDVFDAIFGILVEHTGNDSYEDLVFSALVTVLGIVHDRRFNIGPLVDQYAETKFNFPFTTPCLVRSFTRLLSKPADPEKSRQLRATFKVVRHILKFITHARGQQKVKEAGIGITTTSPGFSRHLRSIFKALDALMRNEAPVLVGSQTLAVQHFHTWLPELTGMLSTEEILHVAIDFMDSCSGVKGKLVLYKLVLIINYSRLSLFAQAEQRSALAANTVRWIAPHWGQPREVTEQWRNQVRLCCSVLATQIDMIGPEVPDYIPKLIDSYMAIQAAPKQSKTRLSLLFPMAYPFPSKPVSENTVFDEALVELSAIMSAIATLPQGMQLELAEDEMATLLDKVLNVNLSILQCEAFPASWLSLHIYHHKSIMATLQYLAGILIESFLPHPDDAGLSYNTELWKSFFTTLLKLVGSDALALETFPEQKRRAVWKIAGDVREDGADLLRRTWEAIGWETSGEEKLRYGLTKMGGYQVQYVPGLVGPIVELCLSVHEGLRRVAVEVLQTMIASEWNLSEDLSVIQTEVIDCMDRLFKSKPLTESILQKRFINELLDLFEPLSHIPEDPMYASLSDLIATIDEFLDLLVAVHSTDESGEASHLIHRLRLMDFLRDIQKEEIFIRYVHQLATLQAGSRNSTEAGLALRLHAELYDWDPTRILPSLQDPDFPSQSSFERKERIYFDMIKHFEDGEAWSSALTAYKELEIQYETNVFDFSKLARTQRSIASIYESIVKSEKIVPKYFRVTYRGMGFPPGLRDKEFVFEGSPIEKTSAFTDRMQEQHPAAQIVSSGDIDDVEGQFLQISSLSPHRDLEHNVFQRARVPHVIRDYILSSHCQQFSNTIRRNTLGLVEHHWAEKLVYVTADQFPTILRRSEIIAVDRIRLSAVQTGLERTIRKTQEMTAVEKKVIDGDEDMILLLVEALNISVNPSSDSSVAHYRELLPVRTVDENGEEQELDLKPLENALRMALIDHAVMIKRCLTMFSQSIYPQLRESYAELSQNFEVTFAPEIASFYAPKVRESTPSLGWVTSPVMETSLFQSIPRSYTNGTIQTTDTSILDTPSRSARQDRSRMSFLNRTNKHGPPPVSFKGNGNGSGNNSELQRADSGSTRNHSKENQTFFDASGRSESGDGGDGDWVTDSGIGPDVTGSELQRSASSQRPDTSSTTSSRVGSVRKRFSMLKLGKKSSKASVLVDSVAEE